MSEYITFTFSHLADAFIQSDLQLGVQIGSIKYITTFDGQSHEKDTECVIKGVN